MYPVTLLHLQFRNRLSDAVVAGNDKAALFGTLGLIADLRQCNSLYWSLRPSRTAPHNVVILILWTSSSSSTLYRPAIPLSRPLPFLQQDPDIYDFNFAFEWQVQNLTSGGHLDVSPIAGFGKIAPVCAFQNPSVAAGSNINHGNRTSETGLGKATWSALARTHVVTVISQPRLSSRKTWFWSSSPKTPLDEPQDTGSIPGGFSFDIEFQKHPIPSGSSRTAKDKNVSTSFKTAMRQIKYRQRLAGMTDEDREWDFIDDVEEDSFPFDSMLVAQS